MMLSMKKKMDTNKKSVKVPFIELAAEHTLTSPDAVDKTFRPVLFLWKNPSPVFMQ